MIQVGDLAAGGKAEAAASLTPGTPEREGMPAAPRE